MPSPFFIALFSVISPFHQKAPSSLPSVTTNNSSNLSDAIANKSSLFNTQKSQTNVSAPPKINYGKPNLAPKPPAQLSLAINNNSNDSISETNRKSVARHQSMKSPR